MTASQEPSHILIVGAGVFGISTARALLQRPSYSNSKITILDASPHLPNPSGSSVDASRIVRADYANILYAKLCLEAQELWRDTSDEGWGGHGRYHEPGLVLTANAGAGLYVKQSFENVRSLAQSGLRGLDISKIKELPDEAAIRRVSGHSGSNGETGYVNWSSGWADAEAAVRYAIARLAEESKGRVTLRSNAPVHRLVFERPTNGNQVGTRCEGVELRDGSQIRANLVVVAAGAWSPSLINLKGRAIATGQALAYIDISEEEEQALANRPTVLNISTGMFLIPPRGKELKVARHGYGYRNFKKVHFADSDCTEDVSVPAINVPIPAEGERACRKALAHMLPEFGERPFSRTRICWYCDTYVTSPCSRLQANACSPDGNWLIDHHPSHPALFVATGGSGHGFKFFPVIGEKIVDAIEGHLDPELKELWQWKPQPAEGFIGTEDGSRAGEKGMLLDEEISKPRL